MEDLIRPEGLETLSYTVFGAGVGVVSTYLAKCRNSEVKTYFDLNEHILEEDPLYTEEMYSEGPLMEFYYDNFDHVEKAYRDARKSAFTTLGIDAIDTVTGANTLGLENYPETAGGLFIGTKIGRKIPTPGEARESLETVYSEIM